MVREYEVQKVLNKKTIFGTDFFLVQWKGYSKSHNTWEPFENLENCLESVEDYVKNTGAKVLDIRMGNNEMEYLIKLKNGKVEVFSSKQAKYLFPKLVAKFLESRVSWQMPERAVRFSIGPSPQITPNPTGQPTGISYITDISHGIQYWLNFENDESKFVGQKEAHSAYAEQIIQYLEPMIQF